jgi:CRP-like cAMP-binding protein
MHEDILRSHSLFEDLSAEDLKKVVAVVRTSESTAGQEVFGENAPGRELYALLSGTIRILKRTREGSHQTLSVLRPGSFFGELSLLDGRKHSAMAECVEDAVLLVLTQQALAEIEKNNPDVALKIIKNLALKTSSILRDMNEQFMGLLNYMW